jgi:peroxiredoxin/hydrogenase maturation factor
MYSSRLVVFVGLALAIAWGPSVGATDSAPPIASAAPSLGTLHLLGGDVYRGQIAPLNSSSRQAISAEGAPTPTNASNDNPKGDLVWKCPAFDRELVIPWSHVERLTQPPISGPSQSTELALKNEFIFQLHNGESITGRLVRLDATTIELESPFVGKRKIPIGSVQSILRCIENTASQGGLIPIAGWKQMNPPIKPDGRSKWFEQTGTLNTETTGTSISQSVEIPDLAAIELDVAWEQANPNWTLTIGEPRRLELHFRKIETRKNISISILVDGDATADVDTALLPSDGLTAISLKILCDSSRGRFVLVHAGNTIAQLQLAKATRVSGKHPMAFTNFGLGRVSLREMRIYPTIFSVRNAKPKVADAEASNDPAGPEILLGSGDTLFAQPLQLDATSDMLEVMGRNAEPKRIALRELDRIEFPPKGETESSNAPLYVAELHSGARYVGQTVMQTADGISMTLERIQANVQIPEKEIKWVGMSTSPQKSERDANAEMRWMRLVSPWAISTGNIDRVESVSDSASASTSFQLFWKPKLANAVPLSQSVSGIIEPVAVSADSRAVAPKSAYPVVRPGQKKVEPDFGRPLKSDDPSLFLKSGDCFPAAVALVDEQQTHFRSPLFEKGVVPNEQVQGLRILDYNSDSIEKSARKKLLTLPRAQRNNPPTHLIVSRQGDAIRGQLKKLTEDVATLEVRGAERAIQMKTVAEIVWLPAPPEVVPPETEKGAKSPGTSSGGSNESKVPMGEANKNTTEPKVQKEMGLRCLALFAAGTRYRFSPTQYQAGILEGIHPELGKCQVDMSKVARIVLGNEIDLDAHWNWFGKWQLENAPDPKFVNDLDDPAANAGSTDSVHTKMIGAAAPDFELKNLEGNAVRLADLKGRIVILDFWATWCGPCVASLPKLNEVAQEYKGARVELLAVNIEQKPVEIQALLNRLEIRPNVLLDTDGSVARTYRAQAIPQTVIIDRDGRVAHIIVGGGDATEKKIRESLNLLLDAGQ